MSGDPTHIDFYSGLGGFALAARACGVRTVSFCEIDPRCRAFLGKAWPTVPCHDDVRTFDGRKWWGGMAPHSRNSLPAGQSCREAGRQG